MLISMASTTCDSCERIYFRSYAACAFFKLTDAPVSCCAHAHRSYLWLGARALSGQDRSRSRPPDNRCPRPAARS